MVAVLEARAQFEGSLPPVHVRVASAGEGERQVAYLDLGDSEGRAVEIRPGGWSVVNRPAVHFRRAPGMMPLPVPESGGTINLLRPYVNLGELDFRLFVAWLTSAIRPSGPYPPLVLYGEQGSAKTTLARVARLLIDPHSTPLLSEPKTTRDLMITAVNSWLMCFDNVGTLPGWLSDCFCRLAVGGGYATRSLYTNTELTYLHAQRPLILNGINDFVSRGDLIDRSVFLHLAPVHPEDRRAESELWSSFQFDYSRILGALLDVRRPPCGSCRMSNLTRFRGWLTLLSGRVGRPADLAGPSNPSDRLMLGIVARRLTTQSTIRRLPTSCSTRSRPT